MSRISILGQPPGLGLLIMLNNISAKIKKGSIVAVVGPKGSGKASLTKVTSGEVKASGGCMRVGGRDIQYLQEAFIVGIEIFATDDTRRRFILAGD